MRVKLFLSLFLIVLVGTGFYTGMYVASLTGEVISDEYTVFDTTDLSAGTSVRIVRLVGGVEEIGVTLDVQDLVLAEHFITLTVTFLLEGSVVGNHTELVRVPYNSHERVTFSVPVYAPAGHEVLLRIDGRDDFGTLRIEGATTLRTPSASSSLVLFGFLGFFFVLLSIFLIVRHSVTRAKVAHFARAHVDGLIHLR